MYDLFDEVPEVGLDEPVHTQPTTPSPEALLIRAAVDGRLPEFAREWNSTRAEPVSANEIERALEFAEALEELLDALFATHEDAPIAAQAPIATPKGRG